MSKDKAVTRNLFPGGLCSRPFSSYPFLSFPSRFPSLPAGNIPWALSTPKKSVSGSDLATSAFQCIRAQGTCLVAATVILFLLNIYTVNHKKRDILFLTITLANLNRFL